MSLADLLPAIRALPRAEKAELLHILIDGVTEASPRGDAALLAAFFPPGAAFEVASPPDGFEAAAALQLMLEAEKSQQ